MLRYDELLKPYSSQNVDMEESVLNLLTSSTANTHQPAFMKIYDVCRSFFFDDKASEHSHEPMITVASSIAKVTAHDVIHYSSPELQFLTACKVHGILFPLKFYINYSDAVKAGNPHAFTNAFSHTIADYSIDSLYISFGPQFFLPIKLCEAYSNAAFKKAKELDLEIAITVEHLKDTNTKALDKVFYAYKLLRLSEAQMALYGVRLVGKVSHNLQGALARLLETTIHNHYDSPRGLMTLSGIPILPPHPFTKTNAKLEPELSTSPSQFESKANTAEAHIIEPQQSDEISFSVTDLSIAPTHTPENIIDVDPAETARIIRNGIPAMGASQYITMRELSINGMPAIGLEFSRGTKLAVGTAYVVAGAGALYATYGGFTLSAGITLNSGFFTSLAFNTSLSNLSNVAVAMIPGGLIIAAGLGSLFLLLHHNKNSQKKNQKIFQKIQRQVTATTNSIENYFEVDLQELTALLNAESFELSDVINALEKLQETKQKNQFVTQKAIRDAQYAKKKGRYGAVIVSKYQQHALKNNKTQLEATEYDLQGLATAKEKAKALRHGSREQYVTTIEKSNADNLSPESYYLNREILSQAINASHHGTFATYRKRSDALVRKTDLAPHIILKKYDLSTLLNFKEKHFKRKQDWRKYKKNLRSRLTAYNDNFKKLQILLSKSSNGFTEAEITKLRENIAQLGQEILFWFDQIKTKDGKRLTAFASGFAENQDEINALIELIIKFKNDPNSVVGEERNKIQRALHRQDYVNKGMAWGHGIAGMLGLSSLLLEHYGKREASTVKLALGSLMALQCIHAAAPFLTSNLANLFEALIRGESSLIRDNFISQAQIWAASFKDYGSFASGVRNVSIITSLLNTAFNLVALSDSAPASLKRITPFFNSATDMINTTQRVGSFIEECIKLNKVVKGLVDIEEAFFSGCTVGTAAAGASLLILPVVINIGVGTAEFLQTDYADERNINSKLDTAKAWVWTRMPNCLRCPGHLSESWSMYAGLSLVKSSATLGGGIITAPATASISLIAAATIVLNSIVRDFVLGGISDRVNENIKKNLLYYMRNENYKKALEKLNKLGLRLTEPAGLLWLLYKFGLNKPGVTSALTTNKQKIIRDGMKSFWFAMAAEIFYRTKDIKHFKSHTQIDRSKKTVGHVLAKDGSKISLNIPVYRALSTLKFRLKLEANELLTSEGGNAKNAHTNLERLIEDLALLYRQCYNTNVIIPTETDAAFFTEMRQKIRRATAFLCFRMVAEEQDIKTAKTELYTLLHSRKLAGGITEDVDALITSDDFCNLYIGLMHAYACEALYALQCFARIKDVGYSAKTQGIFIGLIQSFIGVIPLEIFPGLYIAEQTRAIKKIEGSLKKSSPFTMTLLAKCKKIIDNSEASIKKRIENRLALFLNQMYQMCPDIDCLIKAHAINILNGRCDEDGRTFLMSVIVLELEKIAMALLQGNIKVNNKPVGVSVDINITDFSGNNALHYTAGLGNVALSSRLLEDGAKIHSKNNAGCSALECAAIYKQYELLNSYSPVISREISQETKNLLTNPFKLFLWSCDYNHPKIAKMLVLQLGLNVQVEINRSDISAQTELMLHYGIHILLFFANNLSCDIADPQRSTKSFLYGKLTAINSNVLKYLFAHPSIVAWLIDSGKLPVDHTDDEEKRTPLIWSVFGNFKDTIELLLQHGANKHLKDRHGHTALAYAKQMAKRSGCMDIVTLLDPKKVASKTKTQSIFRNNNATLFSHKSSAPAHEIQQTKTSFDYTDQQGADLKKTADAISNSAQIIIASATTTTATSVTSTTATLGGSAQIPHKLNELFSP